MFDFNLIPLYPREVEKAEETDKPFITSKISNICANHLWNRLAKFRDENTPSNRSFCLVLKSKNTIYAKSTNFFINPTHTNCSENYAVCFEEMLGDKNFNKYQSDYLFADINIKYDVTKNICISINGEIDHSYFKAKVSKKYEEILPYYVEKVEWQKNNGTCDQIELIIMSITHLTLCAENGLMVLSNTLDECFLKDLYLLSFKTGWNNIFGIKKYIPPRKAQLFDRTALKFDLYNSRKTLQTINSSDYNVLMFSFSLFSICKSLFNKRSYTPFILNLSIDKNESEQTFQQEKENLNSKNEAEDFSCQVKEYYGENKKIREAISEIPYCFFTPERCTNGSNKNLFALDIPFSAAATYENMLKAGVKFFSKANFKDFPVVLSGINKKDDYTEYILKKKLGPSAYSFLKKRIIPDNLIDRNLKSPLSFLLIDADFSDKKASDILNYKIHITTSSDTNESTEEVIKWKELPEIINNFTKFIESKLFNDSLEKVYSAEKRKSLAKKIQSIDEEIYEGKLELFLRELYQEMKNYPNGPEIFLSANYNDALKMYFSEIYKNKVDVFELLGYLYNDITQRRKATAYSYTEVKKTLRLKSITEEQYLSYVLLNDYDFIFYSKHFGIDKKVAKKRMKDKIEQWKENYYNSIVAEYMILSRKKSNYMSDKLKEADNILKNIGEVQAEMRSRLKCLLAVVLCFDEFIKAEHPELSDQSEKLIEKTISLNKRLYFRQTLNQLALLDLGSTATTFCSFIKNLERTFDETEDNGRYQKLFFIKENKKDHIGWYDIKRNDYYLMYSGINQCEVYNCFTQYLKNIKMKTEYTFKQILRFMRDEYNAVYTRENPTGTHYQSHKKIGGVDRKLYKIYGDKIDMINADEK